LAKDWRFIERVGVESQCPPRGGVASSHNDKGSINPAG